MVVLQSVPVIQDLLLFLITVSVYEPGLSHIPAKQDADFRRMGHTAESLALRGLSNAFVGFFVQILQLDFCQSVVLTWVGC